MQVLVEWIPEIIAVVIGGLGAWSGFSLSAAGRWRWWLAVVAVSGAGSAILLSVAMARPGMYDGLIQAVVALWLLLPFAVGAAVGGLFGLLRRRRGG